jgi:FMN phosphatase YigB (HAD superfamily)
MIQAVFFDFYGTLAGWEPAAGDIQRRSAAAEGLDVDADAIEQAYPRANALLDR